MAINFNELSTTAPVPTKDEVDNKIDKLSGTIPTGNLLKIANDGGVEDSGKSLDDISQEIQDAIKYAVIVDDKLVPLEGPSSEEVFANGSYGDTYLAEHLPSWTCNDTNQNAVLRNRYGWGPDVFHYDLSLFTDRIVFWVAGDGGGDQGAFTRSVVFPKAGVYSLDIEYAAGYASYPNTMGQTRFVVDAGTSGPQDVVGLNDPSIVQTAHLQFVANAGNGSIAIKGKLGLPGPSCCVVVASVKVTLVKEMIGIKIGDIVAPDASAQTGQAADAKETHDQLSDKIGHIVYNGENHEFLDANGSGSPIAGFTAAGTHRWTTYRDCIVYLRALQSADTKPVLYVHVNNQDAPAQGDTSRLLFKQTLAKDDGIVTPIFLNAGDSLDIRLTDSISQLNYSVFYID